MIAKLDRLARNVAFIANLLEGGVDFVACDMPHANRLTLHLLSAIAEHERHMISERTKAALAAAKAHIEAQGIEVLGPTFHGIFRSIYFFDPNGVRLELTEVPRLLVVLEDVVAVEVVHG